MPVLVLALNPSIDAEWSVDQIQWTEKNLVRSERRWAGGKGVNVARWLRHLGHENRLLLPLGGETGQELARQLRGEKLSASIIPLRQATRVNVIVTTAACRQMRFNPHGPKLSRKEWRAVTKAAERALASADCLILAGSLPREAPMTVYAQLIRTAHTAQCKALLDCDGTPFKAAIKARPFLVKPNRHELAQWFGQALPSESKILAASRALSAAMRGWVLVSCGQRGGFLVNASTNQTFKARAPRVDILNTVGAGDAMLAAAARQIQLGSPAEEWLRWGVATGTAATTCEAGELPAVDLIATLARQILVNAPTHGRKTN